MARSRKKTTPKKKAPAEEEEAGERPVGKYLSLYPLTFEEAVGELLKVKPETPARSRKRPG